MMKIGTCAVCRGDITAPSTRGHHWTTCTSNLKEQIAALTAERDDYRAVLEQYAAESDWTCYDDCDASVGHECLREVYESTPGYYQARNVLDKYKTEGE